MAPKRAPKQNKIQAVIGATAFSKADFDSVGFSRPKEDQAGHFTITRGGGGHWSGAFENGTAASDGKNCFLKFFDL